MTCHRGLEETNTYLERSTPTSRKDRFLDNRLRVFQDVSPAIP